MGFIAQQHGVVNKLNVPDYCRHNYLTQSNKCHG